MICFAISAYHIGNLVPSSETRCLQTSVFCLLVFIWPRTSVPRRRLTSGLRKSSTATTDRMPFNAHTTHSATGASLSPGHVFGTVFRPTCATRTLRTAVSGVNSKLFCLLIQVKPCIWYQSISRIRLPVGCQ